MAEDEVVAYFVPWNTAQPEDPNVNHYRILPHDEFDIGRQWVFELLGVQDRCVSNHHLRIHCVVYEDDQEQTSVAPMVYMRALSSNGVTLIRNGIDVTQTGGIHVDREMGDFLINPGDCLQLSTKVGLQFIPAEHLSYKTSPLPRLRNLELQLFKDRYQLTSRVLGIGGHATVYVAVKHSTGQQLACKMMTLPDLTNGPRPSKNDSKLLKDREYVSREYTVLQNLSHPNIISLDKVFRTAHNIYIFQELITGGDLMSYLDMKADPLTEPNAAIIVRQLLEAVKYLHDNNVVHRDIKPENILMTSWRDGARIVLTDFGQARPITDIEAASGKVCRMQTMVGTFGYSAPEIFHRAQASSGYSQAIDIWSVGCVAGALITNSIIFPDGEELRKGNTTLSQFARRIDVIDTDAEWQTLSRKAKDFIRGCLTTDANHRFTAAQCLQHEWFQCAHYKAEFDAAYQRAVQGWKSKKFDKNTIEEIDTSALLCETGRDEEGSRSAHFPAPAQNRTAQTIQEDIARWRPADSNAGPVCVTDKPSGHSNPRAPHVQPSSSFLQYEPPISQWPMPASLVALQPPNSFDDIVDFDERHPTRPFDVHGGIPHVRAGGTHKSPQPLCLRQQIMHR